MPCLVEVLYARCASRYLVCHCIRAVGARRRERMHGKKYLELTHLDCESESESKTGDK